MKNILLLIFTMAQCACVWAQDYQMPEFKDEPMLIKSDGPPGRLEEIAGHSETYSADSYRPTGFGGSANLEYLIFPGAHSTVKAAADAQFIIKLTDAEVDPEEVLYLSKATIYKKSRIVYTTKTYGNGTTDLYVTCKFEKLAPGVYRITPKALKPGTEYGFVFRKAPTAKAVVFMFGTN